MLLIMTTTLTPPSDVVPDTPTPSLIMQTAHGFMASKHLFAASELGLFEALGARTGRPRRARRTNRTDPTCGPDQRRRHGGDRPSRQGGERYTNTPEATTFLSGATPADLRPLLRFWDRLSYPAWAELAGALGRGRPVRQIVDIDDELVPIMSAGIEAATSGACHAVPTAAGLRPGSRLLDIGGGTGSWSIALG